MSKVHNGNKPMPCKNPDCNHQSRDHSRHIKQPNGSWNGPCQWPECECQLYEKPEPEN